VQKREISLVGGYVRFILVILGSRLSASTIRIMNNVINFIYLGHFLSKTTLHPSCWLSSREAVVDYLVENQNLFDEKVTYFEFGVWKGEILKYWTTKLKNPQTKFFGFDSFEGLPEEWETQEIGTDYFSVGGNLPKIDDSRVQFVKGWFSDTLPTFSLEESQNRKIFFVDCDLYSSSSSVFKFIERYIRPGDIIFLDDIFDRNHQLKAFEEFLKSSRLNFESLAGERASGRIAVLAK